MKNLIPVLFFFLLLPLRSSELLADLQERFQSRLEQIELEQSLEWAPVARAYRDALDRLFDTARAEGNLDELTAIRDEQQRFAQTPGSPDSFSGVPRLQVLQERLREQELRAGLALAGKIVAAAREMDQQLDALQRRLVTEGAIEEALAVRNARQALPERAPVAAAIARTRSRPAADASPALRHPPPREARAFQGRRFLLVRENLTWHDAKARAEEMGGRLAVIDSARLNDFLRDEIMVRDGNPWVWIGLRREDSEAPWLWLNGDPLRHTNWGPDQPSSRASEHFAVMVRDGTWSNMRPRRETWFLCEWGP